MKVLVTGASGFIGSSLCDSLLIRGDTVVGLTRDPERAMATNPTVLWKRWEPTLERPPADAFDGVDVVVTGQQRVTQRRPDQSGGSGDEDLHGRDARSLTRRPGPWRRSRSPR